MASAPHGGGVCVAMCVPGSAWSGTWKVPADEPAGGVGVHRLVRGTAVFPGWCGLSTVAFGGIYRADGGGIDVAWILCADGGQAAGPTAELLGAFACATGDDRLRGVCPGLHHGGDVFDSGQPAKEAQNSCVVLPTAADTSPIQGDCEDGRFWGVGSGGDDGNHVSHQSTDQWDQDGGHVGNFDHVFRHLDVDAASHFEQSRHRLAGSFGIPAAICFAMDRWFGELRLSSERGILHVMGSQLGWRGFSSLVDGVVNIYE